MKPPAIKTIFLCRHLDSEELRREIHEGLKSRMATLARRIFKVLLFVGLFVVSMRFVHTYPLPMTTDQQQRLLELSSKFEVTDSEAFYLSVVVAFNLLLAALEYLLIVKLWRICKARHRKANDARSD